VLRDGIDALIAELALLLFSNGAHPTMFHSKNIARWQHFWDAESPEGDNVAIFKACATAPAASPPQSFMPRLFGSLIAKH
jgi:hypothetical protein